jgi:hypothetical protein
VNLSKTQLQSLTLRPAQSGRGVELAADAEFGGDVKLAEGDALLSINGIGTDKMDMDQVRCSLPCSGRLALCGVIYCVGYLRVVLLHRLALHDCLTTTMHFPTHSTRFTLNTHHLMTGDVACDGGGHRLC